MNTFFFTVRRVTTRLAATAATVGLISSVNACSEAELPAGTVDLANIRTPAGALGMYRGVVVQFQRDFHYLVVDVGHFTDELALGDNASLDARRLGNAFSGAGGGNYNLQTIRGQAQLAIGALAKYGGNDPSTPPALRGEAYALEGYAEVLLADLYCSGIPLSTLDFDGDFTYKPGSTTRQVYAHAITLFDSALALSADSARIMNLARVGKGRALLALDSVAQAATAIAAVPTDFQATVPWTVNLPGSWTLTTVADRDGVTGLPYRSSGDPRTAVTDLGPCGGCDPLGTEIFFPTKYDAPSGVTSIVFASGVEARLIDAEAALRANDITAWLTQLNTLRTTGTIDAITDVYSCPVDRDPDTGGCPMDSTYVRTDTLWHQGSGGVAGLRPLTDPGNTNARVDLLFSERAYWLFLTGHRQGDLRRLVRNYHRPQDTVYPSGQTIGGGERGNDVVFPINGDTERANPYFTGCFDRNA